MQLHQTPPPAIPAAKNRLSDELIYRLIVLPALRHGFDRIWVQSVGPLPETGRGPYIFYLNHSSWWDGYLTYALHRIVLGGRLDIHLLMEERQLRAYRFFTWSGAFSINRSDPEDTRRSLTYAANLLRERRERALVIFPQGRIVPNDQRPLLIYPGIARIAAMAPSATLCPVALRYEFLGQQWPHAFLRVGRPHSVVAPHDAAATLADLTARLTASVDALRDDVVSQRMERFRPILHGRLGIDKRWDAVRRLFARMWDGRQRAANTQSK